MESQQHCFGFVPFAEIWNARLVMLDFVIGLATEWLSGVVISAPIRLCP
jgi:hypothetical protein